MLNLRSCGMHTKIWFDLCALVVEADFFTHMYVTNMYMNGLMNAISLVA